MREPTHKLYLDDSGTKGYSPSGEYQMGRGDTRYFVFGGLLLRPEEGARVAAVLRHLKQECFGQADVEIKANWLRRSEEKQRRYLDRFGVSEDRLTEFTTSVYDLIREADVKLLACVVDKVHMVADYGHRAYYPPAAAYEYVMQRVQNEMCECDGLAHVTIDDMQGATPRGRQYRANLENHHASLQKYGSKMELGRRLAMDRIAGLSFKDSAHDERIQLADLVAYAVYRQFVDHGEEWEGPNPKLPVYDYLSRIALRFRRDKGGRIQGFGIVKAPRHGRRRWAVREEKQNRDG